MWLCSLKLQRGRKNMTVKQDEWVIFFEVRHTVNDTLKLHFWNKHIMPSSNGNMFCVTGPICGNPPVTGEFLPQRPMTRKWCFLSWINGWANNGDADDLRRHRANYDVTSDLSTRPRVMTSSYTFVPSVSYRLYMYVWWLHKSDHLDRCVNNVVDKIMNSARSHTHPGLRHTEWKLVHQTWCTWNRWRFQWYLLWLIPK